MHLACHALHYQQGPALSYRTLSIQIYDDLLVSKCCLTHDLAPCNVTHSRCRKSVALSPERSPVAGSSHPLASIAMGTAVDSGRQRHLLQQAQTLTAELRSMPMDPASTRSSYPRMFDLVRLVKRFIESTAMLPQDETRAMWEQRGQWLQEEVAALAQERIHSPDQHQYWLNLLLLLFAAADVCDRVLREKVELEQRLSASEAHAQALEAQVQDLQQRQPAQASGSGYAGKDDTRPMGMGMGAELAEEVLELRAKVAVLSADADRRRGEGHGAVQQLQLVGTERDMLRGALEESRAEASQQRELAESRLEVIQTLMESAESHAARSSSAESKLSGLQAHADTLAANMEANAAVVQKLVDLNAELMDALNARTTAAASLQSAMQQGQHAEQAQPGHEGSEAGHAPSSGLMHDGRQWMLPVSTQSGTWPSGSAPGSHSHGPMHGSSSHTTGMQGTCGIPMGQSQGSAWASAGHSRQQPASTPNATSVPQTHTQGHGSTGYGAATSSHAPPTAPASLADAFEAFMRTGEAPPPPPATAALLAQPPPNAAGHGHGHSRGHSGAGPGAAAGRLGGTGPPGSHANGATSNAHLANGRGRSQPAPAAGSDGVGDIGAEQGAGGVELARNGGRGRRWLGGMLQYVAGSDKAAIGSMPAGGVTAGGMAQAGTKPG